MLFGGILFFITLFLFTVSSILITTFNNSLSSENLMFTENENITRYLDINRYANVTSGTLNLSGFSPYTETADIISCTGNGSSCELGNDGNYSTFVDNAGGCDPIDLDVFENYTIPSFVDNTSIVIYRVWGGNDGGDTASCFNYSSNSFVGIGSLGDAPNDLERNLTVHGDCLNGVVLQLWSNIFCTGGFYEGAMKWTNNSLTEDSFPTDPYLEAGTPDGIREWSLRGAEFQNLNVILDELNDTNTILNLTFTGNENQTVYVNIPQYANATEATVNLSGFTPYIEYSDSYFCIDNTTSCDLSQDGNWSTYTTFTGFITVWMYENYTVPVFNNNELSIRILGGRDFGENSYCFNLTDWENTGGFGCSGVDCETNISIPDRCVQNNLLQMRYSLFGQTQRIYETALRITNNSLIEESYPNNTNIEIGTVDNIHEWNFTGEFNHTNNKTDDFSSAINSYLSTCSADTENYCQVPMLLHSDTSGILQISDININYTNISQTLDFSTKLNDVLDNGACTDGELNGPNCTIPFLFHSDTAGILQYFDIDINYESTVPNDTQKFIIQNSSGSRVGWLGNEGNIVLKGSCNNQTTCTAPTNSFRINNESGDIVAYIDTITGDMCIESSTSCQNSDEQVSCGTTNPSFIIMNSTDSEVIVIDRINGDLCLTGRIYENQEEIP